MYTEISLEHCFTHNMTLMFYACCLIAILCIYLNTSSIENTNNQHIINLELSYNILHILGNTHLQKIDSKSIKVRVKIQFFSISHIFEMRFISHALKGWMHPWKHYKTNNMHPFIIIFSPRQDLVLLSYKRSDMAQFIVYRLNHNKHITKIYINYV